MKKTKTQKGITLVALIITIVVLLILAVVAVTAIQNDGILGHANNAATQFNQKQEEENTFLNEYEDLLNKYGLQHTHAFTTTYEISSSYEHKVINTCTCGYVEEKVELHNNMELTAATSLWSDGHSGTVNCDLCGDEEIIDYQSHVENEDGICKYCDAQCDHTTTASWSNYLVSYDANYCYFDITCENCNRDVTAKKAHIDDGSGYCSYCGNAVN